MKRIITMFPFLPIGLKTCPSPADMTLENALQSIKEEWMKKQIEAIREEKDPNKRKQLKTGLPVYIFSGQFSEFGYKGFKASSNLICLDIDHIPTKEQQTEIWKELTSDEYIMAAWLSPSGDGFKCLVKLENDKDGTTHKEYFAALKDRYPYIDRGCSDICRACFISSDPNLYVNPDSKVWTTQIKSTYIPPQPATSSDKPSQTDKVLKFLYGGWEKYLPMIPGCRNTHSYFRAREMAEYGIEMEVAIDELSQYIDTDFPKDELEGQVKKAYQNTIKNNKFNSKRL